MTFQAFFFNAPGGQAHANDQRWSPLPRSDVTLLHEHRAWRKGSGWEVRLWYTNTMLAWRLQMHPSSGTATGDSSALTSQGWPTSYQPAVKRPAATAKHRHRRQQDTPGDMLLQGCRGNLGE